MGCYLSVWRSYSLSILAVLHGRPARHQDVLLKKLESSAANRLRVDNNDSLREQVARSSTFHFIFFAFIFTPCRAGWLQTPRSLRNPSRRRARTAELRAAAWA